MALHHGKRRPEWASDLDIGFFEWVTSPSESGLTTVGLWGRESAVAKLLTSRFGRIQRVNSIPGRRIQRIGVQIEAHGRSADSNAVDCAEH